MSASPPPFSLHTAEVKEKNERYTGGTAPEQEDAMTQKERMEQGLLYDANYDPQLLQERNACKELCFQINSLPPSQWPRQETLFRQLLGGTGQRFMITTPFWCDYGRNIRLGEDFYANHNLIILDGAPVSFGDHVFIGPNCTFSTAGHPLDPEQRNQGLEYAYPIRVGNNVWLGAGVTVLPGVTIGDNTVVGAGSLVNRDLPAGVVAAGSPCRVLRPITDRDKEKYKA